MGGPTRDEILNNLRRLAPQHLAIDPAALSPEARLADIGIDSFALIELIFVVEEAFNIRIPLEGISAETVDDVVSVVQRRLPCR